MFPTKFHCHSAPTPFVFFIFLLILLLFRPVKSDYSLDKDYCRLNSSYFARTDVSQSFSVYIQVLFEETGCGCVDGRVNLAAALLAVRHVNKKNVVPGYELRLVVNYTKCDLGYAVDAFFHALYSKQQTIMLLGPGNSTMAAHLGKITPYWNLLQMSSSAISPSLSDKKAFPTFYRTVAPESSHNLAKLHLLQYFQWDTVSTIAERHSLHSMPIMELGAKVENSNITLHLTLTVTEFDYKEQLKKLKDGDARIIIASFSNNMAQLIFCEAYQIGLYGKEYVWILNGDPVMLEKEKDRWWNSHGNGCSRKQLDLATTGIIVANNFVTMQTDKDTISGMTMQGLYEESKILGHNWTVDFPHTYDAVWALALTLRQSVTQWSRESSNMKLESFTYTNSNMTLQFISIMENLCFEGVTGPILFRGPDRVGVTAFHQKLDSLVQFAVFLPEEEILDFHCYTCKPIIWQGGEVPIARRIFKLRINTVNKLAFIVVTILSIIGIIVAVMFLIFNLYFRKLKYIKLSSPKLNNMTVIGCILVYTAVILLGVDFGTLIPENYFSIICTVRAYLLSSGFSLAFGSMFTKTYRVHKLFTSSCIGIVKNKMLKDKQLIAMVSFLLLIDCFLVTLWITVDPMDRRLWNLTIEISKTERNVAYMLQVEQCSSEHMDKWLGALYVYKGLLLVFGCYMAWETRNVKFQALNDSRYIGLSVYNVVITSAIVVFIANILSNRVTLSFLLVASLILVSTTTALFLLFLPKILVIFRHQEDAIVVASMGLKVKCNTRRFEVDEAQELRYRAEVQNRAYKKEIVELDLEIVNLTSMFTETCERTPFPSPTIPITSSSRQTRTKKRMRSVFHKKNQPNFNVQSFDLSSEPSGRTSSAKGNPCCNSITMSLPSLDTSTGHSPEDQTENQHVYYCDDEIDNFEVFHEVVIGEMAHRLCSSRDCGSDRDITMVPIGNLNNSNDPMGFLHSKQLKVEQLRRELLKIKTELKSMEQNSANINTELRNS